MSRRIVVAVTGASGAVYARRLLECLVAVDAEAHLICSPLGRRLLADELGITELTAQALVGRETTRLVLHNYREVGATLASGSYHTDGMVICPASVNTMGAIAAGLADNLITRAAGVTLKESRRLILVPREMPWSQIDLANALRISQAGGIICPASPGFYLSPQSIEELVDFVVGRLLNLLRIDHDLNTQWNG